MRKISLYIVAIIFISFLILGYIFQKQTFNYLEDYLSRSEQVKANLLIVEGWLPDYALKMAYDEFHKNGYKYVITTGLKSSSEYYNESGEGYLIFYPGNKFSGIIGSGPHIIEVDAYGELGPPNRSHFNFYINDSLVADFLAEKWKKKYGVTWKGNVNNIDSILIQFTNDGVGDYGDRNLFVKGIIIDHIIKLPYQDNSVYDIGDMDGKFRFVNSFTSGAEFAKNRLLSMGIDSSFIIAIPCKKTIINRTLTSAISFRDWLKTTEIDIKGINIISMGTHSRRTWMTYNRVLNEKYKIGIISLPDLINSNSLRNKVINTIRETLVLIYYWFILIPY